MFATHDQEAALQQIRRLAALSIQRDCFVAAGCIFCLMFALFPFADVALRTGAVMTGILALALMISARIMPERNYRQTEIWRSLERNPGIPEALAGRVINEILAREYRRHAEFATWAAAGLWVAGTLIAYS